jgi:low molecular weight protein-tyrosine phosphatase
MKILMVCMGNICRSPIAEGILKHKLAENNLSSSIKVDSAGTINMHKGENPDDRAVSTARKYGVDISKLIARQFVIYDFEEFDRIYVMDSSNLKDILSLAKNENDKNKVSLLLNIINPNSNQSVPDPYYGGQEGFDRVFKMIEHACDKIVQELKENKL